MSSTSQAFQHWHECKELENYSNGEDRKGYRAGMRLWSSRLPGLIRDDFPVADHISVKGGPPILLRCDRCELSLVVSTTPMLGMFLDQHNQCDSRLRVWKCVGCDRLELWERYWCRYCEGGRCESRAVSVDVLRYWFPDRAPYQIWRAWDLGKGLSKQHIGAVIHCGSLREALRAGRALYPREEFRVVMASHGLEWEGDHAAK